MLESIFNAVDWLVSTLSTFFQFVVSLIEGLLNIIASFPAVVNMITQSISHLPPTIAAFAGITISICTMYVLVGRDTGG